MGGRRHWTTALVFRLTELTPLGAAISDQRCAPRPTNGGRGLVKERSLDYDSITTRHAAAFNYVKKPDCPPERRQNSTCCVARRYVSTSMVKSLESYIFFSLLRAITSGSQENRA